MNRGSSSSGAFTNPVLVGASIVIALVIGVFLSYNANRGLPFVKTYKLQAKVRDAAELVVGSEVRIGGFRVGQVVGIEAKPSQEDRPPYAQIEMNLDGTIEGIPADTVVRVRPRSLLGAKYVELEPGDGRPLPTGTVLPLRNARATPELDETFNVFDEETRKGLQGTIRGFGDALAGRGPDINRSIAAMRRVLPSLQRVSETLAEPRTDLDGFVDGLASAMGALAPVSDDLGGLMRSASTTFAALDDAGEALERTIVVLPPAMAEGTAVLREARPVVQQLADLTVALRRGTVRLPQTADRVTDALIAGTRVLRRTADFTEPFDATVAQLDEIATDPRAPSAIAGLRETVALLEPTVSDLRDAQVHCNAGGLWARNLPSAVERGDRWGTWLAFVPIMRAEQTQHAATPDPELHVSTVPTVDGTECEVGNEPYVPGTQVIGSPAGRQRNSTEETAPPPGVRERARAAGLLDPIPGTTR